MHPSVHPFFLQKKHGPVWGDVLAFFDPLARYPLQRKSFLDRHVRDPGRKNPLSLAVETCALYQSNDLVGDLHYGVERVAPWASSKLF